MTTDVTPRYCEADPVRGRQAGGGGGLAQHHRGRARRRSRVTDNLNFGNPERPEIMGQFVGCHPRHRRGLPARSTSRSCPATSRSTTRPTAAASCRRPPSAASACSTTSPRSATLAFKAEQEAILLVGETAGWLGQSLYLREICGREEGAPPPVDLAAERRNGDFVRALIADGHRRPLPRLSDGGLLVALAEMAMAAGIGAELDARRRSRPHAFWFGEDQGRYRASPCAARRRRAHHGPRARGRRAGPAARHDRRRRIDPSRASASILVAKLRERIEGWLPRYMAGGVG